LCTSVQGSNWAKEQKEADRPNAKAEPGTEHYSFNATIPQP